MTYEINIYKAQADYDAFTPTHNIDGILRKRDALAEGKRWLKDHAIVKVQSDDREFIEVFRSEPDNICPDCGDWISNNDPHIPITLKGAQS